MKLGLGTVQLGLDYGINNQTGKPDQSTAFDILSFAVSSGVDCFDTAPTYGGSEEIIGKFIKSNDTRNLKISTKIKALGNIGNNELEFAISDEIMDSIHRLKVKSLDYCLLHNAGDLFRYGADIIRVFDEFTGNGVIRKFGVSVYTPADIDECLKYNSISVIQIPFNVFDNRLVYGGYLERLKEREIEIHARSVYLQGLLLMDKAPERLVEADIYLKEYGRIAKQFGLSKTEAAFLYVRDNPFIDRFFIGCEKKSQLIQAVEMNKIPAISMDMIKIIRNTFKDIPVKVINPSLWNG